MSSAAAWQPAASMSMRPTVAPQLASFAATERPSPRPAPVTSTARSAKSCWIGMTAPLFGSELPPIAVAHDPAGGRIAEVRADDHHLAVGVAIDERTTCRRALRLVHVEIAVGLRGGELDRVMHHVPCDDG